MLAAVKSSLLRSPEPLDDCALASVPQLRRRELTESRQPFRRQHPRRDARATWAATCCRRRQWRQRCCSLPSAGVCSFDRSGPKGVGKMIARGRIAVNQLNRYFLQSRDGDWGRIRIWGERTNPASPQSQASIRDDYAGMPSSIRSAWLSAFTGGAQHPQPAMLVDFAILGIVNRVRQVVDRERFWFVLDNNNNNPSICMLGDIRLLSGTIHGLQSRIPKKKGIKKNAAMHIRNTRTPNVLPAHPTP